MTNFLTKSPPAIPSGIAKVSFPKPRILLVTLSRPETLNCISVNGHIDLHNLYSWFDFEPSLRCAVLTGSGRAFCAGADLKEWRSISESKQVYSLPSSGFGGLSTRSGLKPIICAVNGMCYGGGFEMVLNSDMIFASPRALFGLPEAKIGVAAIAGALPRLPRVVGRQRAMEMALTGRSITAQEMQEWGIVNEVVKDDKDVVSRALEVAELICNNSPDGIVVSKQGIELGWGEHGVQEATQALLDDWQGWLESGENLKEGLRAFAERRPPIWTDLRLISKKSKL